MMKVRKLRQLGGQFTSMGRNTCKRYLFVEEISEIHRSKFHAIFTYRRNEALKRLKKEMIGLNDY
jgi:hypothetical protein